jgi:hypothetical protein
MPEANFILAFLYIFGIGVKMNGKLAYTYFENATQHRKELYCIFDPSNIADSDNIDVEFKVEFAYKLFELLFLKEEEIKKMFPLIDTPTSQTNNNNKSNDVVIQHGKLNLDEKPKEELKTPQLCTIF